MPSKLIRYNGDLMFYNESYVVDKIPTFSTIGLIGRYPFDGSTADLSGFQNNFIESSIGYNTYVSGVNGTAIEFHGGPLKCEDSDITNALSNAFTISFWYYHGTGNTGVRFVQTNGGSPGYGWVGDSIIISSTNRQFVVSAQRTTSYSYSYPGDLNTYDTWHHVAWSWQTSTNLLKCYWNGIYFGSLSVPNLPLTMTYLELAQKTTGLIYRMDQLYIYNRVLTDEEILDLYIIK